ncbi:hypothetical protein VKT23_000976 [Stygiomarasmius scandens]|uniref:DUF7082 domain-containing protein n=1 Tax=Marasmiellus scandens TaxID=2682957 RepID=A0ABR1K605_9AGAR
MISVLSYAPSEGEPGVPLTLKLSLHHPDPDPIFLRLVVGQKPVATKVRELDVPDTFQLDATAPDNDDRQVTLTVQALNHANQVLESVSFGHFRYWRNTNSPTRRHRRLASADSGTPVVESPIGRRRAATTSVVSTSSAGRRIRANSLVRTKFSISKDVSQDLQPQTPILQLITPLDSVCQNWDQAEITAGRRLVRFNKVQDGRKLILSCTPISQEDYVESDSVISCIYRDDLEACFVTSVDIIYLLERLTNDEFPVEEKNRIRRNLEGLRPTTVSKHKPGSEAFFQKIMEFPDPKPRNIEKDLKVFDWSLLGQALDKILSKYSVYTSSSPTDSTISLPAEPTDDPNSLCHVPTPDRDHFPQLVHTAPIPTKFEPVLDDRNLLLLSSQENNNDILHPLSLYPDLPSSLPTSQPPSRDEPATWSSTNIQLGISNFQPLSTYQLADMHDAPGFGAESYHFLQFPSRDVSPTY